MIKDKSPNKTAGYAYALEKAVGIVNENQEGALLNEKTTEDGVLTAGLTIASTVLTALAAEIILKAWIAKSAGAYPQKHDLHKLFKLAKKSGILDNVFTEGESDEIQDTLRTHANDFTQWRYLFENVDKSNKVKHPNPKIKKALRMLIDRYKKSVNKI